MAKRGRPGKKTIDDVMAEVESVEDGIGAVNPPDVENPENTFEPADEPVVQKVPSITLIELFDMVADRLSREINNSATTEQYKLAASLVKNAKAAYGNGNLANGVK